MGSICQILADLPSHSHLPLWSLYSFELVHNTSCYTVQNNTNGVKHAAVPSRVPIPAIFGCKQFNISLATRSVSVCFAGSTPYWSWPRIYFSILNVHSAISTNLTWESVGFVVCGSSFFSTFMSDLGRDTSTGDPPTVDIQIDLRSTYVKIRSIVDRRLNIKIIFFGRSLLFTVTSFKHSSQNQTQERKQHTTKETTMNT